MNIMDSLKANPTSNGVAAMVALVLVQHLLNILPKATEHVVELAVLIVALVTLSWAVDRKKGKCPKCGTEFQTAQIEAVKVDADH